MGNLEPRSTLPAGWRCDRAQDADLAAGKPLKQCGGFIGGAACVFSEVGRCESDLGSRRGNKMVENIASRLAIIIRKTAENSVDVGSSDRVGPAKVLERLQAQLP